jgi:D-alanyl-D-alanine carboxypeptidase (penicillin-binding protein 5/6)
MDATTGQVLYTDNAEGELAIASTTKLMTALVVLQDVKRLGEMFTQNDFVPSASDSQIGLVPGERMSVHDLLLAMMLPSADDAAEDLAANVGRGSVPRFIGMMNAEAAKLGLSHTHYSTPIGLDTPGNYSSPCDLVKLATYDLNSSPFFRRIVALKSATLTTGRYVRHVVNLDYLLDRYPWINGVKTGHTNDAGYVLVSSGTQHGLTLISSVLGTSSEAARDANGIALQEWGFSHFAVEHLVSSGSVAARLPVNDRPGFRAAVITGAGFSRLLNKATRITRRLVLPRQLSGPLPRHTVVGHLLVFGDGTRLADIPLLLAKRLPAVSPLTLAARFLERTSTLLLIVAALGLGTGVVVVRRERTRAREIEFP